MMPSFFEGPSSSRTRWRARLPGPPAPLFAAALLLLCTFAPGASAQLEQQPTNFEQEELDRKAKERKPRQLTKAPELLEAVDPVYPESARAEGREGVVILRIDIDSEGLVSAVSVLQSAGADLDWAAMGAVSQFVFSPAEFDNEPAPVAIEYQQNFALDIVVEQVPTDEALAAEAEALAAAAGEAGEGEEGQASIVGETGPINFTGVIREAGNKVELDGVEVSVEVELPIPEGVDTNAPDFEPPLDIRTAYTDEEGRFYFRGVPNGRHRVAYALTGYEPSFSLEDFGDNERTEVVIYLEPLVSNKFETVVRERRARKEVAKVTLSREEAKKIPGTFGDPLRVVENLPGLARAPFIGGALIVRGANPGDTGTYFDGVPIPILYHFGGLKSVVNAEFLEEISFYPGGFPAYYGRAIAGIVDVRSRDLNMKYFKGAVDVSVIDTSFFFGGPIKVHESLPEVTIAAAARRSYIDALIPIALDVFSGIGVIPDTGIVAAPVYWDYQLKAETRPWSGHIFSVFAFGSQDDLSVVGSDGDQGINLGVFQTFHRLVGRYQWRGPAGFTHTFQPFLGIQSTDIGLGTQGAGGLGLGIGQFQYNWGLRDELRWKPNDFLEIAGGFDYLANTFNLEIDIPLPLEIGSFPRVQPRIPPVNTRFGNQSFIHRPAFYVEGVLTPIPRLQIVPSVRMDAYYFTFTGEEQDDGTREVDDNALLWNVDPRITGRFSVFRGTTVKGAIGVYRQPPDGFSLAPGIGNPHLVPPRAIQLIGGFEQRLTEFLNLDVQAYFTARDLLVQSTNEFIQEGNGSFSPVGSTNGGLGRTFGVEFLLRHEISRYSLSWMRDLYKNILGENLYPAFLNKIFSEVGLFGWIAYTLSRSEIDTSESRKSYQLTSFDQTHILTLVGQANLPLGFTFGGRFRLVSGNPSSLPLGSVHDLDTTNYNGFSTRPGWTRLPTFHQLDLRIDRKFVFDNFSLTPYLDLLNAYNQQNAEFFQVDYRSRERELIPSLPILPNFGLQGEF
jgi:TonB family protein